MGGFFMFFEPMYLVFAIPGLLLAGYASFMTKSTFKKYSNTMASSQLTGAQAARQMLNSQGLQDVQIERVEGFLSDHYDPRHRVLRLSPPVHDSPSLSAVGVACHEAGHALQHAQGYVPLKLRSALVPAASFGSKFAYWILFLGITLQGLGQVGGIGASIVNLGLILFTAAVVFSVVTLPVEWDASARAKVQLVSAGIVTPAEQVDAGRVLNAAFLTYLAAAVSSILTLIYFLIRSRR
jgi:Zn-dependent membrane protease YugP